MRILIALIAVWVLSLSAMAQTQPVAADDPVVALRHALDSLLTERGLLAKEGDQPRKMLADVANRSGELARQADDPQQQLDARVIQARAYNALTQDAMQQNKPSLASLRMIQMRRATDEASKLDTPQATFVGDTWRLMADLIEGNRNARTLREQQASAMAQLGRFVTMYGEEEVAADSPVMLEVKLSLLHLYDQAGDNQRALVLLSELLEVLDPDDERAADFADIAASAKLVGEPIDSAMRQRIMRGRWMLWVISDAATQPTPTDLADIKATVKDQSDAALMLHQVSVDDEQAIHPLPQDLGQTLPRYVLIDRQGVIRAIGHTPAVLDRLEALLAPIEPTAPLERIEVQHE